MLNNLGKLRNSNIFRTLLFRWREKGKPGDLFEPTGENAVTWGTMGWGRCWWQRLLPCNIYTLFFTWKILLDLPLVSILFLCSGDLLGVRTKAKNRRKYDLMKETLWRTSADSTKSQGLCFIERPRLGRDLDMVSSNPLILELRKLRLINSSSIH